MKTMKAYLVLPFVFLAIGALVAKDKPRITIQVVESSTSSTLAPAWTQLTKDKEEPPREVPQVHVKAIMPDGRHVILWCQGVFTWTRCKPLGAGSYSAEVSSNSVLVYTYDLSGKEQHPAKYSYAGDWSTSTPSPAPPQAVVSQPARTETPTSVNPPPPAETQERQSTFTWSSKDCNNCRSTRAANFYEDGSGLFVEAIDGIDGNVNFASAGLAGVSDNLMVAVGVANGGKSDLIVNPMEAITLESDSSSNMVLYAVEHPDRHITEDMDIRKKQFKKGSLNLGAGQLVAGYLFFPGDFEASLVTVVMRVGNQTFRFPFVRNPKNGARFEDPERSPVTPGVK
jgi:hypothetical protein